MPIVKDTNAPDKTKTLQNLTLEGPMDVTFTGECHWWQNLTVTMFEAQVELMPQNRDTSLLRVSKSTGETVHEFTGITLKPYYFFNHQFNEARCYDLYFQSRVVGTLLGTKFRLFIESDTLELYFEGELNPINQNRYETL